MQTRQKASYFLLLIFCLVEVMFVSLEKVKKNLEIVCVTIFIFSTLHITEGVFQDAFEIYDWLEVSPMGLQKCWNDVWSQE